MNIFIGIAALLTLLALAWFVRPLLRSSFAQGVSSQKLNAAIHRDQLAALEADLARGAISQQDFESTRDELQLRLLDDTQSEEIRPAAKPSGFWTGRRTAGVVAVFVPVLAIGMYLKLGAPAAIDPVATAQGTHEQMQQMIDTLAARLKANPDNPKGWIMLARSYKMMGRFNDARDAFDKAHDLVNTEPDLLVDYADVLAVLANNNLDGKPMEMVNKALETAITSKPAPLYDLAVSGRIQTGNFEDDFEKIKDCDWIIEVVVENLEIKKAIFERV